MQIPNVWEFRKLQHERDANVDERARDLSLQAAGEKDYLEPAETDTPKTHNKGENDTGDDELDISKIPRGDEEPHSGQEEKDQLMKKSNAGHTTNKVEFKGYRIVKDPVTGNDVVIKDADFRGES